MRRRRPEEYHVTACVEHLCYILLSMSVFKMYFDIFYHMDHVSEINDLSYLILSIHGTISATIQLSESGNFKVLSTTKLGYLVKWEVHTS